MGDRPTKSETRVLEAIAKRVASGAAPTLREICEDLELASTSWISYALKRLEERGCIVRVIGAWRGVQITAEGYAALHDSVSAETSCDAAAAYLVGRVNNGELTASQAAYELARVCGEEMFGEFLRYLGARGGVVA